LPNRRALSPEGSEEQAIIIKELENSLKNSSQIRIRDKKKGGKTGSAKMKMRVSEIF